MTDGHGAGHRLINGVRRIRGKLFLYYGAQGTGSLEIYKLREPGCTAAPCGYVAGASIWRPGNGQRWPEDAGSFIWTNANGDGAPDSAEFAAAAPKPRWGLMHLDDTALNVTLRKNGEYVLFLKNAGLNHVMMSRWTPRGG